MSVTRHVFKQLISYRYSFYTPPATSPQLPRPLLVSLHGYGQTGETSLRFGQNLRRDWPLAALQAPHPHQLRTASGFKTGFGWISGFEPAEDLANHHQFLQHVIEQAFAEGLTDRPAAFLFGFSQAVSLNYRFALAHPASVRGLIAVAGATPSDWREAEIALSAPVLHVAAREDEVYREQNAGFRAVLERSVQDLTWLELPGTHRVPSSSYAVMRTWLDARSDSS